MSGAAVDDGHGVGAQRVGDVGVHHDLVDVDHRADRVEVHGGPLLRDRHGEHGVREVGVEDLAGQPLDAGGRRPLADADRDHARREQQDVAALDVLVVPAVDLAGARGTAGARCRSARSAGSRGRRAGIASEVIATRSRTHTLESRVNSRLGSGSMRKSSLASSEVTRPKPPRTSSLRMPGGEVAGQLGGRGVAQRPAR